jgi:hypothetical protein
VYAVEEAEAEEVFLPNIGHFAYCTNCTATWNRESNFSKVVDHNKDQLSKYMMDMGRVYVDHVRNFHKALDLALFDACFTSHDHNDTNIDEVWTNTTTKTIINQHVIAEMAFIIL